MSVLFLKQCDFCAYTFYRYLCFSPFGAIGEEVKLARAARETQDALKETRTRLAFTSVEVRQLMTALLTTDFSKKDRKISYDIDSDVSSQDDRSSDVSSQDDRSSDVSLQDDQSSDVTSDSESDVNATAAAPRPTSPGSDVTKRRRPIRPPPGFYPRYRMQQSASIAYGKSELSSKVFIGGISPDLSIGK